MRKSLSQFLISDKQFNYKLLKEDQLMSKIKDIVTSFDLFPTLVSFRSQGSESIANHYTGAFSLILYGLVLYLFIDTMISTITLQSISATQTTRLNDNTDEIIDNIAIGLGLQLLNLKQNQDILQVNAYIANSQGVTTPIPVVPCTKDIWPQLTDERFQALKIENGMCVPRQFASIRSFSGQPNALGIYLTLSSCNNATSPITCKTPTEITNFFLASPLVKYLACSLYILSPGINPGSAEAVEYTIDEKELWLLFTQYQEIVVQTFLGKFQITTDTSFFPWVTEVKQTGYQVTQTITTSIMSLTPTTTFVELFVFGAPQQIIVDRSYGKITQILGYVGGLFGLVVSFFAIFIGSYNRLRYQLAVSAAAFTFKNSGSTKMADFTFLKYLKYTVYTWSKQYFCCKPQWQDCKAIEKATSQSGHQIEVGLLLDRISYLQRAINNLAPSSLQLLLHLSDSHTIQEVQHRRQVLQYFEKFTHGYLYTTIEKFDQQQNIVTTEGSILFNGLVQPTSFFQLKQNQNMVNTSSLKLMKQYVQKYIKKFNITDNTFELNESQTEIQKQLSSQFFKIQEGEREKFIKKIPLGILYRFLLTYKQEKAIRNYSESIVEYIEQEPRDKQHLKSKQTLTTQKN